MTENSVKEAVAGRLQQAGTALDDARFLVEGNRSSQSIVNRAYYAMFYAALALLETIGRVPSKHAGVISLFDTEFVLKGELPKDLSKDFHKAFELRQVSDYRIIEPCSADKAVEAVEKATRFVDAVAAYVGRSADTL
jgi:uncharacterized protein (UPF0332 family)